MSVIPYLTIPDGRGAEAAEFYRALFGASEGVRMPAEDGKRLMHCELHFAGGTLYLSDDFQGSGSAPALASVFLGFDKAARVDELTAKAKTMGVTMIQEPQDMFWGDRFAMFRDPFGHRWQVGAPKG
jgi:PhnB protein